MAVYEIVENEDGSETIKRTNQDSSVSFFSNDPANADYQAYLNRDNPDWGKPLL